MIPETVNDGAVGDKGVYSTTEDLFKWDQALYYNKLVSKETMDEAISTFKLRDRYEIPYGFGFRIRERNDKKIAYHHGKWNGFRTSLMRYVEDTNTVIVLNHTSSSLNYSIISEIQNVLDDSTYVDFTYDLVSYFLDEGLESTVEYYFDVAKERSLQLDTLKIKEISTILLNSDSPLTAKELIMLKEMYQKGELDTNVLDDNNFLKTLTL
jgi:CubicO group peptidase (beta-lactamase class C family)